jgi:hypothetical protein
MAVAAGDFAGGSGGFGGGSGTISGGGKGGAIFVMGGGNLTVRGGIKVAGNSVVAGASASAAQDGRDFGGGLFLNGNGSIRFSPSSGQTRILERRSSKPAP